jgi:hypothetical protein
MSNEPKNKDEKTYWLDDSKNVNKLLWVFYALCAIVFLADFAYEKHPHFAQENIPNFFGFWGFLCFVFIVFAGKALRKLVMRDEDYYDR